MYLFSNDPNAHVYPSPCKCYSDLRSVWLEKLVLSDEFFPLEMNQQLGEVRTVQGLLLSLWSRQHKNFLTSFKFHLNFKIIKIFFY